MAKHQVVHRSVITETEVNGIPNCQRYSGRHYTDSDMVSLNRVTLSDLEI